MPTYHQAKFNFDFLDSKTTFLISLSSVLYFYIFVIFLGEHLTPDQSYWTIQEYYEFLQPENDPFLKSKSIQNKCRLKSNPILEQKFNISPLYLPYIPDPLNLSSMPLQQRRKLILSGKINSYYTRQQRYFSLNLNNKKVLACIPPKSGASNWQTVIVKMMKQSFSENELMHAVAGDNQLYQLLPRVNSTFLFKTQSSHLNPEIPNNKITDFYDFSFTSSRNPLTRLISAYHSKFSFVVIHTEENPNFFIRDYLPRILKNHENVEKYGLPEPGMRITFQAFLSFILYENCKSPSELVKTCDAHWLPFSYYCQVCNQDYDAVTNTENLEFGARKVFSRIMEEAEVGRDAMDRKYDSTKQYHHNSVEYVREKYFDILDRSVKIDLLKLYYWDFTLYGYDYEDYLKI